MKQKNLFLMCGVPGSGKSTWIRNQKSSTLENKVVISRDAIRFGILKDGEDYFSHENEVFNIFLNQIQEAIDSSIIQNIYVDATHLNERSRNKVLNGLKLDNVHIYPVSFEKSLEVCLAQNELRKENERAYVPPSAIRRMYSQYRIPTEWERHKYTDIIHIK